ncbi:MAG: alpha/beta fold hydrolase [Chitinophagales bacterium]|nr:alpha/beta fold hydrolase [Bacteroidota bacterium]MCB9042880.1 alpha/beta fold hydrolase [Chitinophagales bacterium]
MQLNYKKYGENNAQNLLILHGLFGMLDNWQYLARAWSDTVNVYALDLRNHGKSPHLLEMDYYLMAEDIIAFVEENALQNVSILGHSMGGKVAMQAAVSAPELFEKLIVVDIAPKDYPSGHDDVFKALFAVNLVEIQSRNAVGAILAAEGLDDTTVQFFLKNLYRTGQATYDWRFNLPIIYENYAHIIANSLTPYDTFEKAVLFIKGGNSPRYIEMEDLPLIAHYFPNYRLEVIPNAGHWVNADQPEVLEKAVREFLAN